MILRAAVALALAAVLGTAQAGSVLPRGCDRPLRVDAAQQDRLLRFAAVVREALADSKALQGLRDRFNHRHAAIGDD